MTGIDRVRQIIEPTLMAMGFDLVRVQLTGGERRPTLQVMAERHDRAAMTVEDCAEISRSVSALLDVEDPIPTAYTLEVSSPGIDRPLTRIGDFERFRGFEAKIESRVPVAGRKRFRGRIEKVEGDQVVLRLTDGAPDMAAIPFDGIARAKLVLTDDLIDATGGRG